MNLIKFDSKNNIFHLSNDTVSYIFELYEGNLIHKYYGKKVLDYSGGRDYPSKTRGSFAPDISYNNDLGYSLASLLQEYPGANQGDYRSSAFEIRYRDGSYNSQFRYLNHEIVKGVIGLDNMPYCHDNKNEAETLIVYLKDNTSEIVISLYYTIYAESNIIVRKTSVTNQSSESVMINNIKSFSLDFPESCMELIQLPGTWGRERQIVREKISDGIKRLCSVRGTSSHNQNPFMAICNEGTTEFYGNVYGISLVYSGNHEMIIQKDSYSQLRIQAGINSETFEWELNPDETFYTPEVVLSFSTQGLNALSQTLHEFINGNIVQSTYKNKKRPILLNNWEATYMDFDENKIIELMEESSKLGIECFVLDDGWFGQRNDDTSSLGDWFVNLEKLPNGLSNLSKKARDLGMDFGLWFEPEMVSPNSELYRCHPDWTIHNSNKEVSLARNQKILDLGRKDVRDYLYKSLCDVLDSGNISYVKWDMNRNFSETYSLDLPPNRQKEANHRYVLGLYELLSKIVKKYPDILFESCSGGGGRYDLGMLYYMPQTWTSDNTDAIERLKIQYGTSLAYPISSMAAHVSASPNHQNGRITPLKTRGDVAMSGVLGYELNVMLLSNKEKEIIRRQIQEYKKYRELIQYGIFYRLISPFERNKASWMFVSTDKSEALVFYCNILSEASPTLDLLYLAGLEEDSKYQDINGKIVNGDELMNMGYYVQTKSHQKPFGDFESSLTYLKKV
ncbi:alpha-galactosidase [Vagococcus bubulae]|uniref:Alpha-galactosidase n=1 Tax=Vagococcus bubulae TaxID=1977868 RepID=A0A429ZEJ9_9ENTE|nr:alpha-galactosidase [Vagococcus bubulae]RST92128.1 alpha-galactosidase [Vagococcus bubulae]